MNAFVINSIRFLLFVLFQVLVLNNLEIGGGMYPMLYPLFIFLLPFEMGTVPLLYTKLAIGPAATTAARAYNGLWNRDPALSASLIIATEASGRDAASASPNILT